MKKSFILSAAMLIAVVQLYGQKTDVPENTNQGITFRQSDVKPDSKTPLFVITADNKELQIASTVKRSDRQPLTSSLNDIDPDWIQSMTVLKDKAATDQYGKAGQEGVILIDLKKGSLDKMPRELSEKFKVN